MLSSEAILYDQYGSLVTPKEKLENNLYSAQGMGLAGNIFSPENVASYRRHYYTLQDNESGLDSYSRELLVRWSRELCAQLPFMATGIRLMAQYVVGDEYYFEYKGKNKQWGDAATNFINGEFYNWCCVRGSAYDFRTCLNLVSTLLDQDGDMLFIYGQPNGLPQFQVIPSNRIRSPDADNLGYSEANASGSIVTDGVVYDHETGESLGWNVVSLNNVINQILNQSNTFISNKTANLFYDPRFFDKGRSWPSFGPGILQAMSLQELVSYLMEKTKIESCVALVEATPSGQGPKSLADTAAAIRALASVDNGPALFGAFTPGVGIVSGPTTRYIRATGGDLRMFAGQTAGETTLKFMTQLETQVLSLIGVPHQLIFSPDQVSGRISDGIMLNFVTTIRNRQRLLDKQAKRIVSWALSVAMKKKLIPENNDEDITKVFKFSHPQEPDLNQGYSRQADINDLENNIKTLPQILSEKGKKLETHMNENKEAALAFFQTALEVSQQSGIDVNTVISYMNNQVSAKPTAPKQEIPEENEK